MQDAAGAKQDSRTAASNSSRLTSQGVFRGRWAQQLSACVSFSSAAESGGGRRSTALAPLQRAKHATASRVKPFLQSRWR